MTTQVIVRSTNPNHQAVKVEAVQTDGTVYGTRVLGFGESTKDFYVHDGSKLVITEAPLSDVPPSAREFTQAEKMAGVPFNPSGDYNVANCKGEFADCIARMLLLRDTTTDAEVKRMASIAITELQTAQMWAVKAITWKG